MLSVFLLAYLDSRISAMEHEIPDDVKNKAKYFLDRDKRRAAYVQFYTDSRWDEAKNYDVTVIPAAVHRPNA